MSEAPQLGDLTKALSKPDVAKNLNETMKNNKDFADKAQDMKDAAGSVKSLIETFIPFKAPLQLLLGEIQGETAKANADLMTDMIKAIESKTGQEVIKSFSGVISSIMENTATILSMINDSPDAQKAMEALALVLDNVTSGISDFNDQLDRFQKAANGLLTTGINANQSFGNSGGNQVGNGAGGDFGQPIGGGQFNLGGNNNGSGGNHF